MLHISHRIKQALVEKVLNLNLELNQQLRVMNHAEKENSTVESNFSMSMANRKDLSAVIPFMVRGLQTFQKLLLDALGSILQRSPKETTADTMQLKSDTHPLVI